MSPEFLCNVWREIAPRKPTVFVFTGWPAPTIVHVHDWRSAGHYWGVDAKTWEAIAAMYLREKASPIGLAVEVNELGPQTDYIEISFPMEAPLPGTHELRSILIERPE